jgi:hypothetical protein
LMNDDLGAGIGMHQGLFDAFGHGVGRPQA